MLEGLSVPLTYPMLAPVEPWPPVVRFATAAAAVSSRTARPLALPVPPDLVLKLLPPDVVAM